MFGGTRISPQVMNDKGVLLPHPFLEMIEAICIAWFTLEYIVRCGCSNVVSSMIQMILYSHYSG